MYICERLARMLQLVTHLKSLHNCSSIYHYTHDEEELRHHGMAIADSHLT